MSLAHAARERQACLGCVEMFDTTACLPHSPEVPNRPKSETLCFDEHPAGQMSARLPGDHFMRPGDV